MAFGYSISILSPNLKSLTIILWMRVCCYERNLRLFWHGDAWPIKDWGLREKRGFPRMS